MSITLAATRNEAAATPLKPKILIKRTVSPQFRNVQRTIYRKVIFTFPIAFNKLVRGTVIEAKSVFKEKNNNAISAGSHFSYLGKNSIRYGEKTIIDATT